ncbi:uncharacterized protein DUF955 [Paenibacillus cellulosilyticus]|uniref:Uncharacterized protein DUF955 n=1 Tax=Paenibacillus cellulosilyticus TaxID=375489 RepID=A0A2V2Z606_9BACL|nr:ImmA/IrrE family metallo-endopeptidase [Paenibacillus cellulosilyticus]PWW06280.1 uncharacterized protein DUF955 [Paenibacillus cellulosilyticus]QKS42969.1 ImmA/IrrE family metallo-endopeptidase [Paenibacillus cellulosilyticus]
MSTFDISLYRENDLERWISKKYQAAGIFNATDLGIDRVAPIYEVEVKIYEGPSFAQWHEGEYCFMFLNNQMPLKKMREHFFHELCHPVRHVGLQNDPCMSPLFRQLQETQAEAFQLYASMPAYLLEEFTPYATQSNFLRILTESFLLPYKLVERRITQMLHRINHTRSAAQLQRASWSPPELTSFKQTNVDDRTVIVLQDDRPSSLLIRVHQYDWDSTLYISTLSRYQQTSADLQGLDALSFQVPASAYVLHPSDPNLIGVRMAVVMKFLDDMKLPFPAHDIDYLQIRIVDIEYALQRTVRLQYDW